MTVSDKLALPMKSYNVYYAMPQSTVAIDLQVGELVCVNGKTYYYATCSYMHTSLFVIILIRPTTQQSTQKVLL